ncbi:Metallo-hydrolase/oxidoreductase, partial [Clavulina sp. PMI_390]
QLSPRVLRILGQNPGKFTLQGTNTYLIGSDVPYILFDAGDAVDAYIPFLESALRDAVAQSSALPNHSSANHFNPLVSDIIISHRHHDHHAGLPAVLSLIHKLGLEAFSLKAFEHAAPKSDPAATDLPLNDPPEPIIHDLINGQILQTHASDSPLELKVIHTPGHTTDSISVLLPSDHAMFSADTVLGEGTAVFEDLGVYMRSLQNMLDAGRELVTGIAKETSDGSSVAQSLTIYPGHGPVIKDGLKTLETYISHRAEREAQILGLLPVSQTPEDSTTQSSIASIVRTLYAKYPPAVWPAAERGVWLHLEKLENEGKVAIKGGHHSSDILKSGGGLEMFSRLREAQWVRLNHSNEA